MNDSQQFQYSYFIKSAFHDLINVRMNYIPSYLHLALILQSQLMRNQAFQIKVLIKQNTQMANKLQVYRRENQQLNRKNQNLNCWVQNLSDVFANISAAWKVITDNEQGLYNLMRKKSDANSKALINKYISHFKTFDDIITNLGEKITNEGHSQNATIQAKTKINLFLVQTYFKFNDEYVAFINEKVQIPNMQQFTKNLMSKQLQNRQKIKQFENYFIQFKQNIKIYENYNKHKLLDGIILQNYKEIQELKQQNQKKSRRISYMIDYNTNNISKILEIDQLLICNCGGAQLQYYNKIWQQNIKKGQNNLNNKKQIINQGQQISKQKILQYQNYQIQKQNLLQRNIQCLSKFQKLKLQMRLYDQIILQSPVFINLKTQFNDLIDYTNDLVIKLNKNYQYLNQLQKARIQQLDDLKQKYEKNILIPKNIIQQPIINIDNKILIDFKQSVLSQLNIISNSYQEISLRNKQKQNNLNQIKDMMKNLKKQNDDLNRKLNDIQQKISKNVQHLQYRHSKFNQLENKIIQMFKKQSENQQIQKYKKIWDQFVDYVKTRDKKIKAMEDQIRKKDKEIGQKIKLQEVLKSALSQTQAIYIQSKEKLDKFQQFMSKIEKQIINLFQQNYKIKIQSQQQKNFLNIRLKAETQIRSKLEQKVKHFDKIQTQIKLIKQKQLQVDKKIKDFNENQKQIINKLRLQIKQKDRQILKLNEFIQEKQKLLTKIIEDKQKKNSQINKLKQKLKSIQDKTQYQVLNMQLDQLKSKIMCSCGNQRQRQVALMTCPHFFCKKCIEDSVGIRNRKCPLCGVKFSKTDIHQICWN